MTTFADAEFVHRVDDVYKVKPSEVTPEMITKLREIKEQLWTIKNNKETLLIERQEAFDLLVIVHKILGMKEMNLDWRPKETKSGGKGGWIATDEQRSKNVKALVDYIGKDRWAAMSPYEQGTVIALAWGTVKQ